MTYTSHAPLDLDTIDADPFGTDEQMLAFLDLVDAEMEAAGAIER